jgi:hypothetical protein
MNRRYYPLGKFFMLFHSKFEMPVYIKVVSLTSWTTFIKVDFDVFR